MDNSIQCLHQLLKKGEIMDFFFDAESVSGSAHNPTHRTRCYIRDKNHNGFNSIGEGSTRKAARTAAAALILKHISQKPDYPNAQRFHMHSIQRIKSSPKRIWVLIDVENVPIKSTGDLPRYDDLVYLVFHSEDHHGIRDADKCPWITMKPVKCQNAEEKRDLVDMAIVTKATLIANDYPTDEIIIVSADHFALAWKSVAKEELNVNVRVDSTIRSCMNHLKTYVPK